MITKALLILATGIICVFLIAVLVGIGIIITTEAEMLDKDDEDF